MFTDSELRGIIDSLIKHLRRCQEGMDVFSENREKKALDIYQISDAVYMQFRDLRDEIRTLRRSLRRKEQELLIEKTGREL